MEAHSYLKLLKGRFIGSLRINTQLFLLPLIKKVAIHKVCTTVEEKMSNKQLENFITKAQSDKNMRRQITDCGSDNVCVSELGKQYGHKFSPANVGHWQRDHGGGLIS